MEGRPPGPPPGGPPGPPDPPDPVNKKKTIGTSGKIVVSGDDKKKLLGSDHLLTTFYRPRQTLLLYLKNYFELT
jgi:hypothetical protein